MTCKLDIMHLLEIKVVGFVLAIASDATQSV